MSRWWFTFPRWWLAGLLGAGLLIASFTVQHLARAQGEERINTKALEKKLEEVLKNQEELFKRLDAIAQELQIVKVRCTN
jgi:hypothetical protein